MLIEKRQFFKGMNGDDSQRLLDDKQSLNLMNCRMSVSEQGRMGRLENIPGTTQISQSVYPPYGTQLCLGSAIDIGRSRILFFLINTHGDNGIYCYDYASGLTYAVLYDSQVTGGLGFSKTSRIDRNAKVVGNLLYWSDNLNPPRRINIEAGIKMNHASYSTTVTPYSWPMTQDVIAWIRKPFGLALTAVKATDGGFAQTFLNLFSGQFASQYIYRDGEYTVMSAPSAMLNYNYSTDTFNAIDVTFPLTETFDQDVQIIRLAVRKDNNPNYSVVKEWNRANATDLAEINAHNAGSVALTYRFYNDKKGVPIGTAESVKPFDSLGLTIKTIEFADQRMFVANYVKGYDVPATSSLYGTPSAPASGTTTTSIFHSFSSYQIAIRFRDKAKRASSIVVSPSVPVSIQDRNFNFTNYIATITWILSNTNALTEIPSWAYYYDILITKNLRTREFIQSYSGNLQYAKKNADGTFSYQSTYDAGVFGIAVDIGSLINQGIGYIADVNDLCRLYLGTTATVYELSILAQDGNYVIIKAQDIGNLTTQPGCYFEIYTPYKSAGLNEPFYTTGQTFKITNPGTSGRTYSTTVGTISGDVTRFYVSINIIIAAINIKFEAMSPNLTVWQNWNAIYGEENFQTQLGQVNKTGFISWSNAKIIGAQTNGLSTFDALDEKAVPQELGQINKLQLTNKIEDLGQGNIMLAICPADTASLYLSERQLMASAAQGDVATSTEVIGTINVLNGSMGTNNPESVFPYLGLVFFFDSFNGKFVQYSANGLDDVSANKMSRFFKKYAVGYLAANANNLDNINGFHHIPTAVDPFNKEILCTLPGLMYENYASTLPSYSSVPSYATSIINRFDIYDQLQKTMAFSFEENKWGSNYQFIAEWYDFIDGQLFAWKNGVMYKHNSDTTNYNTFYGTQYPMRICFPANASQSLLKNIANICVEGNVIPNFAVAYSDYPNIQITDLASTDSQWVNQEGQFYGTWLRDRLSPNASGTADQKLFTGDPITGIVLYIMLEIQPYTGLVYINFVDIGWEAAKGQQQIVNTINS